MAVQRANLTVERDGDRFVFNLSTTHHGRYVSDHASAQIQSIWDCDLDGPGLEEGDFSFSLAGSYWEAMIKRRGRPKRPSLISRIGPRQMVDLMTQLPDGGVYVVAQ